VSDKAARLLGIIYGNLDKLQQRAATLELLTWVNNFPSTYDVSDRAARLLGIIYGNQGQLAQRPTSLDVFVQLRTAGAEYDARQIRALTSSDVVSIFGLLPTSKATVFNTAVLANTNFLGSAITPTTTPCILRIYICLNTAGVFSVQRTKTAVTIAEQLNSGTALNANAAYMFDILADSGETLNFQTTVAATILKFSVHEIDAEV
jgi:hypothetical protein